MLNVLTIFGTRPEAIKLAPVVRELQRYPDELRSTVCVTAQHRKLLDQVLSAFDLRPDFDLDLMTLSQTFGQLVPRMLERLDEVLDEVTPDVVLVQGDTNTALCGALVAFHRRLRVGHVEAGLRTHNRAQPFPEEVNRRLIAQLADWHFAPTETARRNLIAEGIGAAEIVVTGNTVVDALRMVSPRLSDRREPERSEQPLILVTAHRRESFGEPLRRICEALSQLADDFPKCRFVFPVHPNPHVRRTVGRQLAGIANVSLIEPLEYVPFVRLMREAKLILTDSGGVQEEAPCLGTPVLVLREESDRPESVEAGVARLVGTDPDRIVAEARTLLTDEAEYQRMTGRPNLFGDGCAASRIVDFLLTTAGIGGGHARPLPMECEVDVHERRVVDVR
jgi:UDP-N-acetylglucosamine 2-epimerase (non-hydrolysing)